MPIYEFYCKDCNTIFNFFSKTINTTKTPICPKCKKRELKRQMSAFAVTGKTKKQSDTDNLPLDEGKMEQTIRMLASEADKINEDDPRAAANLMRRASDLSGLKMSLDMEEALNRLEKGEDPEQIESDMGDVLDSEDPFIIQGKKSAKAKTASSGPIRDNTLHEL